MAEVPVTRLDQGAFDQLLAAAAKSSKRRARVLLHQSPADFVQEMVIALLADSYLRPHRQLGKRKSYVVLQGEKVVAFFDDGGAITACHRLRQGDVLSFNAGTWHCSVSEQDGVIYLESIAGPYDPNNTEYADWAVEERPGAMGADVRAFRMRILSEGDG